MCSLSHTIHGILLWWPKLPETNGKGNGTPHGGNSSAFEGAGICNGATLLSKGSPFGCCITAECGDVKGHPPQYNINHPNGSTIFCFPWPWLIVDSCGNVVVFRGFQVINKHKTTALQVKSSSYTFPSLFALSYNRVVNGILPIFSLICPRPRQWVTSSSFLSPDVYREVGFMLSRGF